MSPQNLNNFGFLLGDLLQKQVNPIKEAVNKIQQNFSTSIPANENLVGFIKHEYKIDELKDHVSSFIFDHVMVYERMYGYANTISNQKTVGEHDLVLEELWVNFQKKGEYNPLHRHRGIYSFVIWLQVPYLIENEIKASPQISNINTNTAGCFQFVYINTLGHIHTNIIPVDKHYENKICFFPSELNHQVYPFYTSDDYRISISGNIIQKIKE